MDCPISEKSYYQELLLIGAYSAEIGHRFRWIPAGCSGGKRPPVTL